MKSMDYKPPYEKIRDAIIDEYIKGASQAGEKLPSDRLLAEKYGVSIATVSKSVSALVSDGLVERRVGSGTYIRNDEGLLPSTGVYLGATFNSYTSPYLRFYVLLDNHLQTELAQDKGCLHYADMRIPVSQGQPLRALQTDIKAGRVNDLIVCRANAADFGWLEELPVRVIGFGVNFGHSVVHNNLGSFASISLKHLASVGCKKVGLISQVPHVKSVRVAEYANFYQAYDEGLLEYKLATKPEWFKVSKVDDSAVYKTGEMVAEEFGFASFKALWSSRSKPDGLVVYHDAVGLGVVKAAQKLGVKLGEDLQVVFHSHDENVWPELYVYPRVSYSINKIARCLIDKVGSKKRTTTLVEPHLVLPDSQ